MAKKPNPFAKAPVKGAAPAPAKKGAPKPGAKGAMANKK